MVIEGAVGAITRLLEELDIVRERGGRVALAEDEQLGLVRDGLQLELQKQDGPDPESASGLVRTARRLARHVLVVGISGGLAASAGPVYQALMNKSGAAVDACNNCTIVFDGELVAQIYNVDSHSTAVTSRTVITTGTLNPSTVGGDAVPESR